LFVGFTQAQTPDCTTYFIAGQHDTVGTVSVDYDGDSATVTFETTGDWVMTGTHLWMGDCANLPLNKAGNAAPGQFPYAGSHNNLTSVSYRIYVGADSCYCVAAHADVMDTATGRTETAWGDGPSLGKNWSMYFRCCRSTPPRDPRTSPCQLLTYKDYLPGLTNGGNPLPPDRNDPTKVLDQPLVDEDALNFVSLGYGGEITLIFGPTVLAVPGYPELRLVETSYTSPDCIDYPEHVDVFVSEDDVTYYYIGRFCQGTDSLEFGDVTPLTEVAFVRIVDVTPHFGSPDTDGYDVNGMECINQDKLSAAMMVPNRNVTALKPVPTLPMPEIRDPSEYIPDYSLWKNVQTVYPNPAKEQLTIQISGTAGADVMVMILNGTGETVKTLSGNGFIDEVIDVSALPNGIYYVRQMVDGYSKVEKIVIQH